MKMGELEKQINEIKEVYEKIAEAIPTANNAIMRNKIVEELETIEKRIAEAKQEFPKCEECEHWGSNFKVSHAPLIPKRCEVVQLGLSRKGCPKAFEWFVKWII